MPITKENLMILIDVLRSAFISLIPYYILFSIALLSVQLIKFIVPESHFIEDNNIVNMINIIGSLFPVLINMSIAYHLSILYNIKVNKIIIIVLSLMILLSLEVLINGSISNNHFILPKMSIYTILIPIVSTYLLSIIIHLNEHYYHKLNIKLSRILYTSHNHIIPFILSFMITTGLFFFISYNMNFNFDSTYLDGLLPETMTFIRMIFSHIFWFFGIHGGNFFDALIVNDYLDSLLIADLTAKEFYDLFVIFGGSGAGLSLLLAIFLVSKDRHITFVGKLALPFAIFNINEILIFGIPIFLNFALIIPFILVPLVNFLLAYFIVVYSELIVFTDISLPWTTPALINVYLSTDGNIIAVLFQIFLILVGTIIYVPFIKRYTQIQSSRYTMQEISDKLDISLDIESKVDIKFNETQSKLVQSHYKINRIIDLIDKNNLHIYYQPKVNIKSNKCDSFEALIRVRNDDGSITAPDFIIEIENSGLASVLDMWVAKRVKSDLDKWSKSGFSPSISINIFPYTLEDETHVHNIISILEGYNITIEIIERRQSLSDKIINNLNFLKENGFKISLDDLGAGYTNFTVLYEFPLDSVKVDKSVIDFTNTKKGLALYENICTMCEDLEYKITLEGIETKEQLDKLKNSHVDEIQGWYYSKALPFEEALPFVKDFEAKKEELLTLKV